MHTRPCSKPRATMSNSVTRSRQIVGSTAGQSWRAGSDPPQRRPVGAGGQGGLSPPSGPGGAHGHVAGGRRRARCGGSAPGERAGWGARAVGVLSAGSESGIRSPRQTPPGVRGRSRLVGTASGEDPGRGCADSWKLGSLWTGWHTGCFPPKC